MEQPIFLPNIRDKNIKVLRKLISNCESIGVKDIVLPLVDNSSILNDRFKYKEAISFLKDVSKDLNDNLNLTLEIIYDQNMSYEHRLF